MSKYNQDATYWAKASVNEYNEKTFSAPVPLVVRWEYIEEMFMDSEGKEQRSHSIVFVQGTVMLEGYLYLGTSVVTDPRTLPEADEIKKIAEIPNLKNTKTLYKIWL